MKELERSLGLMSVVAISISAMLGSGIFVLPGLAISQTGPSTWIAYLLAGLCALPAATCKAELATVMPTSGGTYVYLDRIFGPLAGTIAGTTVWLSMLMKSAFALLGFGTYLLVLSDVPLKPTALGLLGLIAVLNVVGVRKVGRAQVVVVGVTLVALVVLVTAGFTQMDFGSYRHELTHGSGGLLAATAFVFVSYNGVTKVAAIAEEVKNPDRNLPWGILLSLGLMMGLYGLVAFALVGCVPHAELAGDLHPIYTLAHRVGGYWAGIIAAVLGVVTMTSMANAGLLAASRFPFAMSRDQLLPSMLHGVHPEFRTPVASILLTAGAMAVAIAFLDVERLAKLASSLVIMLFIGVNTAVVVYRESRVHWYQPKYRSPFYPWFQGFGILAGLVLLLMLGPLAIVGGAMAALPGAALYFVYGRRRAARRGVVGQRSRRRDLLKNPPMPEPVIADTSLVGEAGSIVTLFGEERSPEMLVEVGAALSGGGKLQVVHLTEVPEQLGLDSAREDDGSLRSLERRVGAMADEKSLSLEFHAIASRDLVRTVHAVTQRVEAEWLVMEWRGQPRQALVPYNPLGWLINQLDLNLALFKDAGVRYVREILVFAEPGPHDALVISTADYLAALWGAELTLVRFVPDSAPMTTLQAETDYLAQLKQLCSAPAKELVIRGRKLGREMARTSAGYDLLVMGAPDLTLVKMLRGNPHARIMSTAACSVLTLKTPRVRTHEAFERPPESVHSAAERLPAFVARDAVQAKLDVSKKDALFQHFARVFSAALGNVTTREIVDALWERERTQNTSVGHGTALPHATLAQARSAYVGVFTTRRPIDYQGPDGEPVDVFFVTLCPPSERQTHLQLLSGIAALSLRTDLLEKLRRARDTDEMLTAIEQSDEELRQGRARVEFRRR
jgi:amino acid transporter/mannitol/fructose-specific phosphotransferase system IIA component (Ntr-type)